jgi:hypothetical protein
MAAVLLVAAISVTTDAADAALAADDASLAVRRSDMSSNIAV